MLPYAQRSPVPFSSLLYYDSQLFKHTGVLFYIFSVVLVFYFLSSLALLLSPEPFSTLINLFTLLLGVTSLRSCVRFTLLIYAFSSMVLCVHMLIRFSNRIERPNFGYASDMQASMLAALLNNLISNRQATIFPFIIMDSFPTLSSGDVPNFTNKTLIDKVAENELMTAYTYYAFLLKVPRKVPLRNTSFMPESNFSKIVPNLSTSIQEISAPIESRVSSITLKDISTSYIAANWKDLYELIRSAPSPWRITLEKIAICTTAACCFLGSVLALMMQWKIKRLIDQRMQVSGSGTMSHDPNDTNPLPVNGETVMIFGCPSQSLNSFAIRYPSSMPNTSTRGEETSPTQNTTHHSNFVPFAGDGVSLSNVADSRQGS